MYAPASGTVLKLCLLKSLQVRQNDDVCDEMMLKERKKWVVDDESAEGEGDKEKGREKKKRQKKRKKRNRNKKRRKRR
uniref:Uncharacterized protein n=1 Tax=Octopus bimaculoides TaxID=37653 RepID=A0A0L8FFV4_OCTBM